MNSQTQTKEKAQTEQTGAITPTTWKQVAVICATIVGAVWTVGLFYYTFLEGRVTRMDKRQETLIAEVLDGKRLVNEMNLEIIRLKCIMDKDLCKEGN